MKLDNYQLVERCKKGDVLAKEWLYSNYAPVLLGVCLRYINNRDEAEDVLHESFVTILSKIKQLKNPEALEGWMRKIVVNNALKHLKQKNTQFNIEDLQETSQHHAGEDNAQDIKEKILQFDISQDDIIGIINGLPVGFRTVFNLYAFENYKHDDIAEELGISSGTSRSQLLRARKLIQKKLYELVEQNKKTKKKEELYWASILLVVDDKLTYIDEFVVKKLEGYQSTPVSNFDVETPGGEANGIKAISGTKAKILALSGKKLLLLLSFVSVAGIVMVSVFFHSKKTEQPAKKPSSTDINTIPEVNKDTFSKIKSVQVDSLEFDGTDTENLVDTNGTINRKQIEPEKVYIKKTVVVKKKIIVTDTIRKPITNQLQ